MHLPRLVNCRSLGSPANTLQTQPLHLLPAGLSPIAAGFPLNKDCVLLLEPVPILDTLQFFFKAGWCYVYIYIYIFIFIHIII